MFESNPTFVQLQTAASTLLDNLNAWLLDHQLLVGSQIALFTFLFFWLIVREDATIGAGEVKAQEQLKKKRPIPELNSLPMAAVPEPIVLDAPRDTPFTVAELAKFDGAVAGEPIYVAMKGIIFDVSAKREMYGPGAGYNVFAGKDASRALGRSSLKPEDALADYSVLNAEEMIVLEDWVKYFTKRYNIVGRVI